MNCLSTLNPATMVSFVSIMHLDDGFASYQVNESREFYKAELISATTVCSPPGELTIPKPLCNSVAAPDDKVINKLMQAIKTTESNLDFIN